MRVLWVVNIVPPKAAHLTGEPQIVFGGWIGAMAGVLSRVPEIQLGIAARAEVAKPVAACIDGIQYYLLPRAAGRRYDVSAADCRWALAEFQPELLHIEGTEFPHARTFLESWSGRSVISLQGIINGYEPHQYGGLPVGEMLFSGSPTRALVAAGLILRKHLLFKPRLRAEAALIRRAPNILGRTTWDRAHAYAINPEAAYYSCNGVLRDPFYHRQWQAKSMQRHSIFIGNSASALKGAHFALHAVAQLQQEYPDVRLLIAGDAPYARSPRQWKKFVGYAAYLRHLVRKLDLADQVEFTGLLPAEAMADRMCRAHVFALCSTIENSPNTLGEAMTMGVPAVSAFIGGAPDMARDGEEALFYRDNDPSLLAYQIRRIFEDDALAQQLSANARQRALVTHSPETNLRALLHAYSAILRRDPGLVAQR